ncbi:protein ORF142 [Cyprinid herpesvirus 3]|nr:protein ORF142 [Cyprinid herpesvirus 3]
MVNYKTVLIGGLAVYGLYRLKQYVFRKAWDMTVDAVAKIMAEHAEKQRVRDARRNALTAEEAALLTDEVIDRFEGIMKRAVSARAERIRTVGVEPGSPLSEDEEQELLEDFGAVGDAEFKFTPEESAALIRYVEVDISADETEAETATTEATTEATTKATTEMSETPAEPEETSAA